MMSCLLEASGDSKLTGNVFFFRKGALPSHQQERDTKGASGELGGPCSWGAGINSQSSHFPHFL